MAKQQQNGKAAPWNTDEATKFVQVYNSSASVGEVADKLGIKRSTVLNRARYCRKANIVLNDMGRRSPINWDAVKANVTPK